MKLLHRCGAVVVASFFVAVKVAIPNYCLLQTSYFKPIETDIQWLPPTVNHASWTDNNKTNPMFASNETKYSNIIQSNVGVPESHTTIVTAYFEIPSKHTRGAYLNWMSNMLSLKESMVIFTSQSMVPTMLKLRSHAIHETVVYVMDLDQLPLAQVYPVEFWQKELERDPEKRIHRSYELFWIWLSKTWFVSQAIASNPFGSNIFMWCDIGSFRHKSFNDEKLLNRLNVVSKDALLFLAHHEPVVPPNDNNNNNTWFHDKRGRFFYHAGSHAIGYANTWRKYHKHFVETLDGFVQRNLFVGEDQVVMQSTCLRYPTTCEYIAHTDVPDHRYFGLRMVLSRTNGPNYRKWQPILRWNATSGNER